MAVIQAPQSGGGWNPLGILSTLAILTPAYNFWNQSTQNWLANDKDYVATSSGK